MEKIYDRLVKLSVQRELSDTDASEVGSLFNQVADAAKSALRDDCLFIIKARLWMM